MELRHLNTFRVVAEVKGFTRAAEALGYAQSSVTAQIQALEEELGVQLFNRLGKRIVLTQAGERLLPYVVKVQQLIDNARAEVAENQGPQGTLTIGAPESLCAYRLPALLRSYRERFPQVRIILRPGFCWELRQQVRTGELDVAFLIDERIEMPDLVVESLVQESIVIVAPLGHPLTKRGTIAPQDLQTETVFLTEAGCSYRALFEQQVNACGVYLDQSLEFGSLEAIKQCVISGIGLAPLPEIVVQQELAENKLAALCWEGERLPVQTQLLYHKNKWMTPTLTEFLMMTRTYFGI